MSQMSQMVPGLCRICPELQYLLGNDWARNHWLSESTVGCLRVSISV